MASLDCEVIVVGAGPVGAVAAYRLASEGVNVVLIELNPDCPEDLRASTFHPPTLQMLATLGLMDELESQGLRAPIYQYRNRRTNETFCFDLSELSDITQFPYRLQCEQHKLSRLVTERLAAHRNADVRFQRRLLTFSQDQASVTVSAETPLGIETISGKMLIACDGANSTVRKWMGVGFEGFTYPEKFLTFSTKRPLETFFEGLQYVNYVADPEEWLVLLRVPSVWRILAPAHDEDDAFLVSDEKKGRVFGGLIGDPGVETEHRTIYRVHQRVARHYVSGRAILAGDAAHLNNPLGGFGMNAGIHDVWNLADKLVPILRKGGDHGPPLALYERQRQGVMRNFVQTQTIKNKQSLESREAQQRHQRELSAILGNDARRRDYLLQQAMFSSLALGASIS